MDFKLISLDICILLATLQLMGSHSIFQGLEEKLGMASALLNGQ